MLVKNKKYCTLHHTKQILFECAPSHQGGLGGPSQTCVACCHLLVISPPAERPERSSFLTPEDGTSPQSGSRHHLPLLPPRRGSQPVV